MDVATLLSPEMGEMTRREFLVLKLYPGIVKQYHHTVSVSSKSVLESLAY